MRAHHVESGAVGSGIYLLACLVLTAVPGFPKTPQSSPQKDNEKHPYKISVNVDLVVLPVTVRDRRGNAVPGLTQEDFQVYEDGVPQKVQYFGHEDVPVTVGLVVDNSGSMRPKRPEVVNAGLAFARSSNPQDQIFVVNFNEHVWMGLPKGLPFTSSISQLDAALWGNMVSGRTALYDAIAAALTHLKLGDRDKKVLVVISDGGDNASLQSLNEVMAMAGHSNAIMFMIGIFDENDIDRNPGVLKQFAKATGGQAFLPESATQLAPIAEQVAKDIRHQYTLAYLPTNRTRDGKYRSIRVTAAAPGHRNLLVQTRAGYYAPSAPTVAPPPGTS